MPTHPVPLLRPLVPPLLLCAALALGACGSSSPASGTGAGAGAAACAASPAAGSTALHVVNTGRMLSPVGRLTQVGNFPSGGRLTPDGRYYWAVDSGDGRDDVQVVQVSSGKVLQVLPLPGAYGRMVFAPDGNTAYVSGEQLGVAKPTGATQGDGGDVIHVFSVDPASGHAVEQAPITLPAPRSGKLFPVGLAITADAKTLVAALYQANQAAVIDLASGTVALLKVGAFPHDVVIERSGRFAYVGNELDGTLSKIDLAARKVTATIAGLGGTDGDKESHVEGLLADPRRDLVYAAISSRDTIAVIDTQADSLAQMVSLKRAEGYGVEPVALALTPDGATLYAADAGEDALSAIALTARGSYKAYDLIGKLPTAYYPADVQVTPDGCTLAWTAAKGFNAGPNPGYQAGTNGTPFANSGAAPYGTYVLDKLLGQVGMLRLPGDAALAGYSAQVDAQLLPDNHVAVAPAGTPLQAADGGPSEQIKYVFLVVKENRTYDQLFGSDTRGDGDPTLEVFDDNGAAGPAAGITPNAHALSRMFSLLDRFYEDSEVSVDGHLIASSAYAIDYMQQAEHASYGGHGGPTTDDGNPVSFPPSHFLFDQAVRQNISFKILGEGSAGTDPLESDDGRPTYAKVIANRNLTYSPVFGCLTNSDPLIPNTPTCTYDSGLGAPPPLATSRMDVFNNLFHLQVLSGSVPQFTYMILPNDHTNGTTPGGLTPQALAADNDLGLGQLVQIVSHSKIWPQTAIFVMEDDSQDGADHVDAHRAPAYVISPWALHGGVVAHTRYDQYSMVRTIEMILGLKPQYLNDSKATPMYDLFSSTPDNSAYNAVLPVQSLTALNTAQSPNAALSSRLPWHQLDAVPQELSDRIIYQAVYGADSRVPGPGPNASEAEHRRAVAMTAAFRHGDRAAMRRAAADHDD